LKTLLKNKLIMLLAVVFPGLVLANQKPAAKEQPTKSTKQSISEKPRSKLTKVEREVIKNLELLQNLDLLEKIEMVKDLPLLGGEEGGQ